MISPTLRQSKSLNRILSTYPCLLSLGFGGFLTFSQPPYNMYGLLFICVPALLLLAESSHKSGFYIGWLFGFAYFFGSMYWVSKPFMTDSLWDVSFYLPLSLIGLPALLAVFIGLATHLAFLKRRGPVFLKVIHFCFLWTLMELIRGSFFPQAPWVLLGITWSETLSISQISAYGTIYGLTLLTVLVACVPYLLYKRQFKTALIITAIFISTLLWGQHRLDNNPTTYTDTHIRIVQPMIDQDHKWVWSRRLDNLNQLLRLTNSPGLDKVDIVIWPETAVPFFLREEPNIRRKITEHLPPSSFLITGATDRHQATDNQQQLWNGLHILKNNGEIHDTYHKSHLLPFAEYIPFNVLLKQLPLSKIAHGEFDYTPGSGSRTFALPGHPNLSPMICFEAAFPFARSEPNGLPQPQWIVNLTNDAWFDGTIGPRQHHAHVKFRAIESGLPLIRITNTGVSSIIDPYGRVLKNIQQQKADFFDTKLPKMHSKTPLNALKNRWFMLGILLFFCLIRAIIQFVYFSKVVKI